MSHLKSGPRVWQFTKPSLGTALLIHMRYTRLTERHLVRGWQRLRGSSFPAKYLFTVDYTDTDVADDPAQHKQAHVLQLLDAGKWTGNIVALPNNRVRVTHPAWFETGEGAPDFKPSQHIHYSKSDLDYTLDVTQIFDNLYSEAE